MNVAVRGSVPYCSEIKMQQDKNESLTNEFSPEVKSKTTLMVLLWFLASRVERRIHVKC